jgi:hypothetical protein
MSYIIRLAALAATLTVSTQALAVGGIAQVTIVDRKSGVELVPHYYRGEYWVAGTPGATYSIEIRNRLSGRLLAVASVDGVNVITGANAGWDQAGYVFDPGQGYQITGWRKSDAEVAAFTFTDLPNSYAARTGRPANVGVIGVALFRERPTPEVYSPPVAPAASAVPAPEPDEAQLGANAPSALANRDEKARVQSERAAPQSPSAALRSTPKLGTGHGERESSYVTQTEFERMQPQPNEVIRIRYDSFDNLVAMGVIERPRKSFPEADPFPASAQQPQYVPDPPSARSTGPRSRPF